jgi:glycosyltransferase involved in cell wall biosynthesis
MTAEIKVSLIVSTYNRPDALEMVFESIKGQSALPFEVIVADDGSTNETKSLVEKYKSEFQIPLIHCWQEDKGFRLSQIRNKAIAQAKGNYIVLIDGDIIIHKNFIRDHIGHATPGFFIQGSRVLINNSLTKKTLEKKHFIKVNPFSKGIRNRINSIRNTILSSLFYIKLINRYKCIKGCNMSFWKEDLVKVNGYNEEFIGWGSEDKELVVRLYNNGIYGQRLKFAAIAYHLHHSKNIDSNRLTQNNKMLEKALKEKPTTCVKGIDKYLTSPYLTGF